MRYCNQSFIFSSLLSVYGNFEGSARIWTHPEAKASVMNTLGLQGRLDTNLYSLFSTNL